MIRNNDFINNMVIVSARAQASKCSSSNIFFAIRFWLLFLYFSFLFIHYASFASWTFHIEWNRNWFPFVFSMRNFVVFVFVSLDFCAQKLLLIHFWLIAIFLGASVVAVVCPFNSDWWSCRPVDTIGLSKWTTTTIKRRFKSTFLIETNGWGQHREWLFSKEEKKQKFNFIALEKVELLC